MHLMQNYVIALNHRPWYSFEFILSKVCDYWQLLRLPSITSDFLHFSSNFKVLTLFFLFSDIIFSLVITITINYINTIDKILRVFQIFDYYILLYYLFNII